MKSIFNSVKLTKPPRSTFDLSHDLKLSFSMGELVPTLCVDILPGDVFNISPQNMLRFAPLIAPVMHKVKVTTDFFFVPNRILWPEWEKWITGELDVDAPYVNLVNLESSTLNVGSLADYMGFPTGTFSVDLQASPFPIAAYAKIFDEYYRDQNLENEFFVPLENGEFNNYYLGVMNTPPSKRAWMHDYFTASLPFAQKGDAVQVPLTTQDNIEVDFEPTGNPGSFRKVDGSIQAPGSVNENAGPVPFDSSVFVDSGEAVYDPRGSLVVDVQSDAVDINTLRRAFRLQEWLEKNARGGTRYVENILAHFGVKSSDARLQRPEFIGRVNHNMVISEVLSTTQNENAPIGQMAGHGISVGGGQNFRYRAEEHGYIIGIINVQPVTAYQDGLHRMHTRLDRLDYAVPSFANLGEQEVRIKELAANNNNLIDPEIIFGYVPRYAEYKYLSSRVAGEMRDTLAFWHLGRIFDPAQPVPVLNSDFVRCNPPTRIFAVEDPNEDHIFAHIFFNISASRLLPRFGIPTI